MNFYFDAGHAVLSVMLVVSACYHIYAQLRTDRQIEKLMDRVMSRSVTEYKRVQTPKREVPRPKGFTDADMHAWELQQNKTPDEINQDIEAELEKMRLADKRAGVL